MVYQCISPFTGEIIFFGDIESAKDGALELDTFFFFPRKSFLSTEKQKEVVVLENGIWQTKQLKSMKCRCGENN